jgi:hypothetical protein
MGKGKVMLMKTSDMRKTGKIEGVLRESEGLLYTTNT